MKKFTKLFLSCAAVAALTAAVATSAMAAENKALTAKYEAAEGAATATVNIKCASEDATKTLLILNKDARTADGGYTVKAESVIAIDQAATIESATINALDPVADKGKYTVLMGGTSGDIYVGTFNIGGSDRILGDVDKNNKIQILDALAIAKHTVKNPELTDEEDLLAADADDNGKVQVLDALKVAKYTVKLDKDLSDVAGQEKTIADKTNQTITK